MKKLFVAALGLALMSGTVVFAQNTATGSTDTMSSTGKKHKKSKKGKDTMSDTSGTAGSTK
jgi:hypothetical protein